VIDGNLVALNKHLAEEEKRQDEAEYLTDLTVDIADRLMNGDEFRYSTGEYFGFHSIMELMQENRALDSLLCQIAAGQNVNSSLFHGLLLDHAYEVAAEVVPHWIKARSEENGQY